MGPAPIARRTAPLLTAALACVGACGLLPTSDTLAPFPSDGVSGFGDAEPIEVCIGPAHVVSPDAATGAGAVCVAEGAVAAACTSDASCAGIERCVCGRCIIEACDAGAACTDGRVCRNRRCTTSCGADADCKKGEVCSAGGCARTCAGDGDCHFGERCSALDGTCVAKLCGGSSPCGPGSRCESFSFTGELHEPEIVSAELAFVEVRAEGASAVYRVRIDDPGRWTAAPDTPVLDGAGAPSVMADGDAIELYFADASGIGRAVSSDGGRTFARDAAPVLEPGPAWEKGVIGSPSVVGFGGATLLFYEGGPRAGIGVARVEGGKATRLHDEPIATPTSVRDPSFWRDVTEVGAPYAVASGDALRVYFTARGVEGTGARIGSDLAPADANDSIGMLASLDPASVDPRTFSRYPTGAVFARVTNLRTYLGEREAAVRLGADGGAAITFVASDASGKSVTGLGRAGSP